MFAARAQVILCDSSAVDFSLKLEERGVTRILTFWKEKDSSVYTAMKYYCSKRTLLSQELPLIGYMWDRANETHVIQLHSVDVGYPLSYDDVLYRHIIAFLTKRKKQTRNESVKRIRQIMLDAHVYASLDTLLASHGYHMKSIATEKHGYVTKENLQRLGFTGKERIPMPFMVWLGVEKK